MRPHTRKSQTKKNVNSKEDEISDENLTFESPERDGQTDYGLDFTTSRLSQLNASPRRCSTLRKKSEIVHHRRTSSSSEYDNESEDEENQPPQQNRTRLGISQVAQPKKPPRKATAPVEPKRRKQINPEHRIKKLSREIQRLQLTDKYLIPRLPFSRLVREIIRSNSSIVSMITSSALEALQTSAEMYLTQRFQDAYLLTNYRGRVTLEVRDMAMVAYFCKIYGGF